MNREQRDQMIREIFDKLDQVLRAIQKLQEAHS